MICQRRKKGRWENPGLPTPSAFLNSPMISLIKDFHSLFICQKFVTIMWPYLVAKAARKCGVLYSGSNVPSGELGSLMKREGRVNVVVCKQGPLPPATLVSVDFELKHYLFA